jgi:hypothetical protein
MKCRFFPPPALALLALLVPAPAPSQPTAFFEAHCTSCHNANDRKGGLDLTALPAEPENPDHFARWAKVHDRIEYGEMPPGKRRRPPAAETAAALAALRGMLAKAEQARLGGQGRTGLRRLTRVEYENTVRDLLDLPGITLQGELPADGTAHGFDNNSDALDISHVNLAKYLEAADLALDMAVATRPRPPEVVKQRISLANRHGFVAHVMLHGDAVKLKNKQPDPDFPPAGAHMHLDQGAHERMGSFDSGTVGLFRHEDESFHPYFIEFVTIYPGRYRVRTSLWSFQWDRGKVLPARGTEAARLSVVTLTGDGRGGGHPSTVLGYYDAPSLREQVHDFVTWLNPHDIIGFNAASLAPGANTRGPLRALGFTGPGIACDYLDIEGPLHDDWPPHSHGLLFGDLPLAEFRPADHPGTRPPARRPDRQDMGAGRNRPDPVAGVWTVRSAQPLADADRLLAAFLPRAFRGPVAADTRRQYVARVEERLRAGPCFETALRWAYRAALVAPDFLYHVEPAGPLDDHALACRLSYFFWRSMPDERLNRLADAGKLHERDVLHAEMERLLKDAKSQRFVEDFLGQWLKVRQIAATDPDHKLYPEFSAYLQDSMVGETRAYFRELLDRDVDAGHLVKSDFAMLNEKLAVHYGIPGVSGSQIRRVALPPGCPRGPFLTQAAILKITANGTTTSPVPRGAFVMDRLLGRPPEPPPPNIPAIEPDVRGAHTTREQLDRHRSQAVCASCHARIDPPGFALESFDVIGGARTRYRSIGAGDPAPRGAIDPFIGIGFRLGPAVDPGGVLPDGRTFRDINELQDLLVADRGRLLTNLARQFAVDGTGREVCYGDREQLDAIVTAAQTKGGGIRTLLHELIESRLFQTR